MVRLLAGLLLSVSMAASFASTPVMAQAAGSAPAGQCDDAGFKQKLGQREASGSYGAVNSSTGFLGKYQMGSLALQDTGYASAASSDNNSNIVWTGKNGIWSTEDWLANGAVQEQQYQEYAQLNWGYIKNAGLDQLIGGQTLGGKPITQSSLLFASQFGVGNMQDYLTNPAGAADGAGTTVDEYMTLGSGFDVSNLTGDPSDVNGATCDLAPTQEETAYTGDTTSKTCIPTVPMLQAIDCSKYPASLQGFCRAYKPLQMNMGECQAAESWAENVPPSGPHLESCKQQTFGDGTSSWAYVHACAKAEPAMGARGQDNANQKIVGGANDPACYGRLEAMGLEFIPQGAVNYSMNGYNCTIQNSVLTKGKSIPYPNQLQMSCALAERMEQFGDRIKSLGVTGYAGIQTISCRPMNPGKGGSAGGMSYHGTGEAVDVFGFIVGGKTIMGKEFKTNPVSRAWLLNAVNVGCSVFDRVLAYNYYQRDPSISHIHYEVGHGGSCDPNPS